MSRPHLLFVTGKLAEPALRRVVGEAAASADFEFTIAALPITVISLATTEWIARHLRIPDRLEKIVLPGLCIGELDAFCGLTTAPVERGPNDLRELTAFFGAPRPGPAGYGKYDIEILAEINHAPRLPLSKILEQARDFGASGADIIDLGCDPGDAWPGTGNTVRALRAEGFRVSIDSFNVREVEAAVHAGAELVLSVNSSNRDAAPSWGCEVVAIPDVPTDLAGLDQTVESLSAARVPFRVDPVIEPIGFGFAESIGRYLEVRRRYPDAEMLMGVGNLTELTDVDSAGMNVMLLGFCQELRIRSVLTTQVINWCRSSIRELDLARRLVYHAVGNHVFPKHLEPDLIALRDVNLLEHGEERLNELASQITDPNFRLFAERGLLHVLNNRMFLQEDNPFALFKRMYEREPIDPSHAFYLGYEMCKAVTALTLGKNYAQDQALNWGFQTKPEPSHRGKMPHVDSNEAEEHSES